jgi:hypothetical protein
MWINENEARAIRTPNLLIWSQTRCHCAIAPLSKLWNLIPFYLSRTRTACTRFSICGTTAAPRSWILDPAMHTPQQYALPWIPKAPGFEGSMCLTRKYHRVLCHGTQTWFRIMVISTTRALHSKQQEPLGTGFPRYLLMQSIDAVAHPRIGVDAVVDTGTCAHTSRGEAGDHGGPNRWIFFHWIPSTAISRECRQHSCARTHRKLSTVLAQDHFYSDFLSLHVTF